MGKLSGSALRFLKDVFGRDEQARAELAMSSRDLMRGSVGSSSANVDYMGFGDIGEALGLDRRLLHRFVDYEQMDEYGDITSALDIYSDDATQTDSSTRHSVWVECSDEQIRTDLEEMYYKRVKIEEIVWEITRQTCKYGNDYEEIVVGDNGVVGLNFLPTATVRRIEGPKGNLEGFIQSYSSDVDSDPRFLRTLVSQLRKKNTAPQTVSMPGSPGLGRKDSIYYDDWRVAHFRLRAKNRDSLYGWSITEPARWAWKRLLLLEDAVLVYKLTRSPSRYAFYVDVGNVSQKEGERILKDVKNRLKKRKFVNPKTGKLDFRYNPLAFDEDFFLGVRDGKESTRVDTLMGPSYQQIEDVQYFLYKLYAALKIPRAYLGYDENMPSKATLSQEDVRFARTVLRIQREIRNGIHKVGRVHLAARKIDPSSVDFEIGMTVPSSIFELGQMEVRRARADLASLMERHVSLYWLLSNVYGLSDDEIEEIKKQKEEEQKAAMKSGGGAGGFGGGFESRNRGRNPLIEVVSGISDEELFKHKNLEDEKRATDIVRKIMRQENHPVAQRLKETQSLVRELLYAVNRKAA